MKRAQLDQTPELVELRQLLLAGLRRAIDDDGVWQVCDDTAVSWETLNRRAASDVHQAAIASAMRMALARCYREAAAGHIAPELLDDPRADLVVSVRLRQGTTILETEARIATQESFGQYLLKVVDRAARQAYDACRQRFCVPGQVELRANNLSGLRALKHAVNESRLRYEMLAGRDDAEAFALAGLSPATGNRTKARVGLTQKRSKKR